MGSKEKENFLKYDSLNEFDDYISKKKNSHRHIHPHVRASILDFEFMNYVEMVVNYGIGFFENSTDSDPVLFTYCKQRSQIILAYIFLSDFYRKEGLWEEMIESINLMLVAIDPATKQCVPIYVVVFIMSDFYGPSFQSTNRIIFNLMYRLGEIYSNTAEINRKAFDFIYDKNE